MGVGKAFLQLGVKTTKDEEVQELGTGCHCSGLICLELINTIIGSSCSALC